MPQKVKPTAGAKRTLAIHFVVFAIATIIMVMIHHKQGEHHWAYPWHAWLIAAWGLSLIGHYCSVFFNYEDRNLDEFNRQVNNG